MPYCPELIMRAAFMDRFSEASRHREQLNVTQILADLEGSTPIMDVARSHGLIGDDHAAEEEHLRRDWYNEDNAGWWPDEPVEQIVRAAYAKAIRLADEHDCPIDAYWMPAGTDSAEPRFRATINLEQGHVTLIFHTPPVPQPAPESSALREDPNVCVIEGDGKKGIIIRCGQRLD